MWLLCLGLLVAEVFCAWWQSDPQPREIWCEERVDYEAKIAVDRVLKLELFYLLVIPVCWPLLLCFPCYRRARRRDLRDSQILLTRKNLVHVRYLHELGCCCRSRRVRTIPLKTVTLVDVKEELPERWFGLATVEVETTAQKTSTSGTSQAEFSALGLEDPGKFRAFLLRPVGTIVPVTRVTDGGPPGFTYLCSGRAGGSAGHARELPL